MFLLISHFLEDLVVPSAYSQYECAHYVRIHHKLIIIWKEVNEHYLYHFKLFRWKLIESIEWNMNLLGLVMENLVQDPWKYWKLWSTCSLFNNLLNIVYTGQQYWRLYHSLMLVYYIESHVIHDSLTSVCGILMSYI